MNIGTRVRITVSGWTGEVVALNIYAKGFDELTDRPTGNTVSGMALVRLDLNYRIKVPGCFINTLPVHESNLEVID